MAGDLECAIAATALEGPLPRVGPLVHLQIGQLSVCVIAAAALEGLLPRMGELVPLQFGGGRECAVAAATLVGLVGLLPRVGTHVDFQIAGPGERHAAGRAHLVTLAVVVEHVLHSGKIKQQWVHASTCVMRLAFMNILAHTQTRYVSQQ